MNKFLLTLSILTTTYAVLHTATSVAAQSTGLAISPPVIEILLAPNKKIVHAFQLTNQGGSSEFVANLHTLIPSGSNGHSIVNPTPLDPTTIPLIVSLANADRELGEPFHLDSGDSTQLVLEIEGANTDITIDSYLALVIQPTLNQTTNGTPPTAGPSSSSTTPAISALILTTLSPDGVIPINLTLEGFDLPLVHDSSLPLNIPGELTNNSDIMLRPHATLTISPASPTGGSPRQSRSDEIKLDPNLVLAHSSRTLTTDSQPIIYHPKWYYIGPHQFTINVTTEGGSQITSVTKTIWLLPLRALIILTLLAIFTIYLLLSARKRSHSTKVDSNK